MQTVRTLAELRAAVAEYRREGARVALVPTMGALHAGHIALIEAARRAGAGQGVGAGTGTGTRVVASIFVNPRQFGVGEDLARYPRREATDARMLTEAGCDLLWMPPVEEVYPAGFATSVAVSGVSEGLDGAARPGHFDGVATVVCKLFNQVGPDVALFGEKDFQQLAVVRRMVRDLDMPVEIECVPTQRDDDGLALSSRNVYLDDDERQRAVALPRALGVAARAIGRGDPVAAALAAARAMMTAAGFAVDYVELVDSDTLKAVADNDAPRRLLAAARLGTTRLIDNIAVPARRVQD